MMSFHWWDLIPVVLFFLIVGALVLIGLSIGAGYARTRRRQQRQPDNH